MIEWEKEIDNIKQLVDNGESYESIGRKYDVSGGYIKILLKKFNIKITPRRSINKKEHFNKGKRFKSIKSCLMCNKSLVGHQQKFCSSKCAGQYKTYCTIHDWEQYPEKYKYPLSYKFIKEYLKSIRGNECELCGWNVINPYTGLVPLQLHHINGDCTDNHIENLQLLCPNCHSLTENFGAKNKGKSKR